MGKDKRDCTVVDLLKTCAKNKDLYKGTELHDDTLKKGLLETNPYVTSALISMYAKCGALAEAHHVLETLPVQDVVSWNALIAGYAQQGYGLEALACFEKMQNESCSPTWVTLTSILKACGITRDIVKGKQIHHEIVHKGLLERNIILGNALVDMYAKCGALKKAQEALEELKNRDVVSWSTLIAGYAANNQGHEALKLFACMQREGISPNEVTFICVLKACGSIGALDKGTQIHVHIMCMGMLMESTVLGTALVDMYAKCGVLTKAQETFEEIPHRNLVSWNALISGYAQMGQGCEALNCMEKMKIEGLSPNESTFICLLKACGSIGAIHKGKQIHEEIANMGLLSKNIVLGTALVDMYVKCGVLGKAQQVLEELYVRDVISWNVLIAGYVSQLGLDHEALNCYSQMQREGLSPNEVTFNCILKACGSTRAIGMGKQIHSEILSRGLLEKNIVLGTAMVDMYTKCSMLAKAHKVLRSLHFRDIVAWNALIAGYAQEGKGREVLDSYTIMQREGLSSDEITFTCILKACGIIGAVEKGKQIHDEIANRGLLVNNVVLGGALVDMYAKFGMLAKAQEVLKELSSRDVVSWSALIAGYAEKGHYEEARDCFQEMQREGHSPNEITFLCMLNACSHSGKMDEAQIYYENMNKWYGVTPQLEHHTCMVAILGCAGHLGKALAVIKTMLSSSDPSVWLTLLYYCKKWGNVNVGRLIFDQIIQMEDSCTAAYTLMYDIYAAVGLQQDAKKVEAMRADFCLGRKATMNEHISSSSWNTLGFDGMCSNNYPSDNFDT